MSALFQLIKKDLTVEFRTKETASVMLFLSLLLSSLTAAGMNMAFLPQDSVEKLFPVLTWFVFIVTGAVAMGRTYEYELQNSAMEGIVLTGVPAHIIFLGKIISSFFIVLAGQVINVLTLAMLLDVSLSNAWIPLLVLIFITVFGYVSIATLVTAISSTSKLKGILLPLILLPLLFPLFFAAVELTFGIMQRSTIDISSFWFSLLCGLDLVYLVLGINLYEYLIKD